jgi:hypothetical protein
MSGKKPLKKPESKNREKSVKVRKIGEREKYENELLERREYLRCDNPTGDGEGRKSRMETNKKPRIEKYLDQKKLQ